MKIFFYHKTKSRDASKKCKYKGCQANLLYKCLPKFHFEAGMRDLGETIFESTFYLQFLASLTPDSLANWGSSHLKEMLPRLDKCNLRR